MLLHHASIHCEHKIMEIVTECACTFALVQSAQPQQAAIFDSLRRHHSTSTKRSGAHQVPSIGLRELYCLASSWQGEGQTRANIPNHNKPEVHITPVQVLACFGLFISPANQLANLARSTGIIVKLPALQTRTQISHMFYRELWCNCHGLSPPPTTRPNHHKISIKHFQQEPTQILER